MLKTTYIEKIKQINRKIKKCNSDLELINLLRTDCERIDVLDKFIILNYKDVSITIDKEQKKVKQIEFFDENLKKFIKIKY